MSGQEDTTVSAPSLDTSTPGAVGPANVPNLMQIGSMPINTAMDVETDILEPVVFSETFCRFRLQNKGILHSNSKLTFSVDISSGSGAKSILPLNIGIHSVIDRAVLKVGTKTICETSDFGHFMNLRSSFVNPQHNKQRESITSGRQMCRKWDYTLGANASSASGRTGDSSTDADKYTLDTGMEVDALNSAIRNIPIPNYLELNATPSAGSGGDQAPVFQVTINDLFPFLKMNQLPLYMMKEEIDIELHFASEFTRGVTIQGSTTASAFKLERNECKMIADYIYYPQEIMDAYATANNKMSFTYVDYRLVKHTVNKEAGAGSAEIILNVGGAGRVVNKLFFGLALATDGTPQRKLNNLYESYGLIDNGSDFGSVSHNIKYNDKNLYPIDIKNNARLFHNIEMAEGTVPYISKDEYSDELDLITPNRVFNYPLKGQLSGKDFWIEDRLNRNERINSRGIEIYQTWGQLDAHKYIMRCWLETVKYATLTDGVLQVFYA
jgi:hypothetical protein